MDPRKYGRSKKRQSKKTIGETENSFAKTRRRNLSSESHLAGMAGKALTAMGVRGSGGQESDIKRVREDARDQRHRVLASVPTGQKRRNMRKYSRGGPYHGSPGGVVGSRSTPQQKSAKEEEEELSITFKLGGGERSNCGTSYELEIDLGIDQKTGSYEKRERHLSKERGSDKGGTGSQLKKTAVLIHFRSLLGRFSPKKGELHHHHSLDEGAVVPPSQTRSGRKEGSTIFHVVISKGEK